MNSTAISHLNREPDWLLLRCQPPEQCAESIQAILKALENNERWVYAIRGEALRLFDERMLYSLFTDPATRDAFTCTYRWLAVYFPDSVRYCQEALVSRQRLHSDVPLEKAANISRANLRVLEGVSTSIRNRPEVQDAAAHLTEKQFAKELDKYGQHIEARRTLKFSYPEGDAEQIEKALAIVGRKCGIEDQAGCLLALAIDFIMENENALDEGSGESVSPEQEVDFEGQGTMSGLRSEPIKGNELSV